MPALDLEELAARPFDKARWPEAPHQVHAERQELARQVLALQARLAAAHGGPDAKTIQRELRRVERRAAQLEKALAKSRGRSKGWREACVAARQSGVRARREAAKARTALQKALRRAQEARSHPSGRSKASTPPPTVRRASKSRLVRFSGAKGCKVPGCAERGLWRLVCPRHLKGLPAPIRQVLKTRVDGRPGRAGKDWLEAAAKALKIMKGGR